MYELTMGATSNRLARRWWAMASLALGTFAVALSAGMLLPATPRIMPDLRATITDVAWLSIAYAISFSALQPILGKQADLYGRKLFFVGGLATFTAGAALASFSWDMLSMAVCRFVQGIGAAAVFPAGMAFVGEYFPEEERGRAMGLWGAARGAALALGPIVGGSILDLFGWRAIYHFGVAVGLLCILSALFLLHESRGKRIVRQDYVASILLLLAAVALLLAVSKGGEWGWASAPTVAFVVAFAILAGALVPVERRARDPLLDFQVVGSPVFLAASAAVLLLHVAQRGATFLVPFYLTDVQGFGGRHVGLLLLPFFLPSMVGSPLGGWLADRVDIRVPAVLGAVLSAIALGLLALLKADTPFWHIVTAALLLGLGMGLALPPLSKAIIGVAPLARLGAAAGMFKMVRSKAGPFGVALFATIFAGRSSGGLVAGFGESFLVASGLALLGLVAVLFVRRSSGRQATGAPVEDVSLRWTPEAEALLERVPPAFRERGRVAVEAYARENGSAEVTPNLMRRARERLLQARASDTSRGSHQADVV